MLTKKTTWVKSKLKMDTTKKKKAEDYLKEPYARILIPEEEGGFSAEILEFPGCFAEGESANEAFENLEKTARSWIEAEITQGREIPPPSANHGHSGKIALRLPRSLHRLAMRKAERDGISLNQCLVTAIASWVGADDVYARYAEKMSRLSTVVVGNMLNVAVNASIRVIQPISGNTDQTTAATGAAIETPSEALTWAIPARKHAVVEAYNG